MSQELITQTLKYIEKLKASPPVIKREEVIYALRKILKETSSVPIYPES